MKPTATLAEALAAAQVDMVDPSRSKKNPHLRSNYASLDDILPAARTALAPHGIALTQTVDVLDSGAPVLVTCYLTRSSTTPEQRDAAIAQVARAVAAARVG